MSPILLRTRVRGALVASLATLIGATFVVLVLRRAPLTLTFSVRHATYQFEPCWPLLATLCLPWIVFWAYPSFAAIGRKQKALLVASRGCLVLLLGFGLSKPERQLETRKSSTLLLVDVSASMPDAALKEADDFAQAYLSVHRANDEFRKAAFDASTRMVEGSFLLARGTNHAYAASDYGQALRMAMGLELSGSTRRVVLFGDGNDTHGGLWPAAQRLLDQGFELYVVSSSQPSRIDVSAFRIELPRRIERGKSFILRGALRSTRKTEVTVKLSQDSAPNARDPERKLTLLPGLTNVSFETTAEREGPTRFRLSVSTEALDAFPENNETSLVADVEGRSKVLILDSEPEHVANFADALRAQQFDVSVHTPAFAPVAESEIAHTGILVLSNVGVKDLSSASFSRVDKWIHSGGTLLVAGGPVGYADGGWSGSQLEALLPVSMTATQLEERHDVALVLAIDRSGSMTGLPLELAKSACAATVETLGPTDLLEVIAFDARPVRYVSMQPVSQKSAIIRDLSRISSGGDTELFFALDMAYQDLVAASAQRKHVVLLTDGQSPTSGLSEVVQGMVADNISLTTVGLGTGVDVELLRRLAERGGGRYHAAPTPDSLPRIFIREAEELMRPPDEPQSYAVRVMRQARFLAGISPGELPRVSGYHRTTPKPAPSEVVLESSRGEPILARVARGAGWVIAWTPDLHDRWAHAWLNWPKIGKLFAQLFREHQEQPTEQDLPMQLEQSGSHVHVVFDATREDGSFDNDRSIALTVTSTEPNGSKVIPVAPTAPGRYEAEFTLDKFSDYRLKAQHDLIDAEGKRHLLGQSKGQVSWSYPEEFARLDPDLEQLNALRKLAQTEPISPEQLARTLPAKRSHAESLRSLVLLGSLVLFLVDLALSRVRFRPPANA